MESELEKPWLSSLETYPPPVKSTYPKYSLTLPDHLLFFLTLGLLCGLWSFILYHPRLTKWGNIGPTGEKISTLVVTLSLAASCLPPVFYLGILSEAYLNGVLVLFHLPGILLAVVITAHLYMAVYYRAGIRSSLEYVEKRFGSVLRKIVAVIVVVQYVLFLPFVLMVPAIIFQHVTQLQMWIIFLIFLCLLVPPSYCSSLRSAAWNDLWSLLLIFSILITLVVFRQNDVGGISEIWNIAMENNFLRWPRITSDPFAAHTLWSLLIGGSVTWCTFMCFNPLVVNKCLALNSKVKSQVAIWLTFPLIWALLITVVLCGALCFAAFHNCDPIQRFKTNSFQAEEIIIYFVMFKEDGKWFCGVFVATTIAASLGFVSYSLNVLCDITVSEILRPFSPSNGVKLVRLLHRGAMVGFGTLVILPILFSKVIPNILMTAFNTFVSFGGPLLGLFSLGMFIPWANQKGACAGLICGLIISLWISIGHVLNFSPKPSLNFSITACPNSNDSVQPLPTIATSIKQDHSELENMYRLSYLWLAPISCGTVIVIGLLVSLVTKYQKLRDLNPNLLCPWITWILKKLRFQLREKEETDAASPEIQTSITELISSDIHL